MRYIGIMSGTSLDGIDVALIEKNAHAPEIALIAADTFPFPPNLLQQIKHFTAYPNNVNLIDLGTLNIALGQAFSAAVQQLLKQQALTPADIYAIGSHGQTLFHAPDHDFPFSLQLGDPSVIAQRTGITTVADFRQRDIAAGGQGAPLVPAFHHALFHADDEQRIIINIGGISNISLLPQERTQSVIGFDTGPGNGLLDAWYQQHHTGNFDESGAWAASGVINNSLLEALLSDDYFAQAAPKSTGKEYFNPDWLDRHINQYTDLAAQDVQATLTALTAHSIAHAIEPYLTTNTAMYICGGGAHNHYLLTLLQEKLTPHSVNTTDALGLAPDWVEACAFAWLAAQTLENKPGNLPSVTGATEAVVLGGIYPA